MSVNVYDPINDELIPVAGATLYADTPIGVIQAFDAEEVPDGWLIFNGQTVLRSDYPDLWARANRNGQVGVGKFYGIGDGSTTFTLADLRETSLKGYGETSRSVGAHVKSGGLGIGEFIDDRLQDHKHNTGDNFWANSNIQSSIETDILLKNWKAVHTDGNGISTGRSGLTTEVKAVGVVWAVKARQTGLPIDLAQQVENMLKWTTVKYISNNLTVDLSSYKEALIMATNSNGTTTSQWHLVTDAYPTGHNVTFNGNNAGDSIVFNTSTKVATITSANSYCTVLAR